MKRSSLSELKPSPNTNTFDAIGTKWSIEIFDSISATQYGQLVEDAHTAIDTFDITYSRFRKESLVTKMSHEAGEYSWPVDAKPLLDMYYQLYDLTDGAVNPLIGKTLSDAGYDASYSLSFKRKTLPPRLEDALTLDFPNMTLHMPVLFDFGAAGKGYLVDIVGQIIEQYGIESYLINAGGDMLHKTSSDTKLPIGLENPNDLTQAIGIAELYNGALCGSSGNRRQWAEYTHIIDARTAVSPRAIASIWVMSETALLSDALSTALYFTDPEVLQKHYNFKYAIMFQDNKLEYSADFPADFFTTG